MSKKLTASLLFLSLVSSASPGQAAKLCEDLFREVGVSRRVGFGAERSLEDRVSSINSVENLAQFLEKIGGIGRANQKDVVGLAGLLYRELGQDGVERVVRNLLLSHSHISQEAVMSAFISYARGEFPSARSLEGYLPRAVDQKTFLRWTHLGEQMTKNSTFMNRLELALRDFKDFEYVYGKSIDTESAFVSVVNGLKDLKNPSLVGQFIEFFSKADRVTRQYIFDEVMELKDQDGHRVTVVVKGSSSEARNASAIALEAIQMKPISQLQEEAYFKYSSNGISNRPRLHDAETAKTVALRFLDRMKYDLLDNDVTYASTVLAKYPAADRAIDAALTKLLETGAQLPAWRHEFSDINYARHELLILERNARGLSAIDIDLRYGTTVLSTKTKYMRYLAELLEFHARFDLRNFPALQQIATTYFRNFPESLSGFSESQNANAQKFRKDFGI